MTFIPTTGQGVAAASGLTNASGQVTATTSTTNADLGRMNFANSPNYVSGKMSTGTFVAALNVLNVGTQPSRPTS